MNTGILVTLRQRRNLVELTLRNIENERRNVEECADCLDRAAYRRRARLLDQLTGWYRDELKDIDRARDEPGTGVLAPAKL